MRHMHSATPLRVNRAELTRRRINAGYSRQGLSAVAGLTATHVRHIEAGERNPRPATLKAIADALGCTVSDLLVDEVAS